MARLDKVTLSPQCAAIVSELRGGSRTSLYLQKACYIMAVGTRIHELRSIGFNIEPQLIPLPGSRRRRSQPAHIALYTMRMRVSEPIACQARAYGESLSRRETRNRRRLASTVG